jgi:hypothetical protein
MDHGGRRHHMAAMVPHSRQQSTQQSTNIICDGSTLLKLEKTYILLVILLLMHVASTSTSDDDDAAMRRWAPCSPLDDIADSDAAGTLPMIYSTRADGGGRGGGGCGQVMLLQLKKRWGHWVCDGRTIFLFDGLYVSENVWWPYDINMLLD